MKELSHIKDGKAVMVDVSGKADTEREALACGKISMSRDCFRLISEGKAAKGDVLGAARIAGIMGAKKTSELIPLCHIIGLTSVEIEFELNEEESSVTALCRAKSVGKTGVEMEALTGVSVALLTIYDMCKAVCRGMVMGEIKLLKKSGGKSGVWEASSEGRL